MQLKAANKFVIILAIIIPLCCGLAVLGLAILYALGRASPGVSSSIPPSAPPVKSSLSYEDICDRPQNMTDIQWEQHLSKFKNIRVEHWSGWVSDVYKEKEGYRVFVAMDSLSLSLSHGDIKFNTQDLRVADASKRQPILISGLLKEATAMLGQCNSLELTEVTIEKLGP